MSEIPDDATTGALHRLWAQQPAAPATAGRVADAPPPYRPGDLAWRCGFEHALRQMAGVADYIEREFPENSPMRRAAMGLGGYIRNMKPEPPK
jgi:hypothetical protein